MEHPENGEEYKGLVVNKGIEQPSSVNPYLKRKPKKRQLSVAEFVEGITKGDVTILSQAVTLVESVKPEHQTVAQEVIEKCLPFSGNSIRVGISGVPGAGKSTSCLLYTSSIAGDRSFYIWKRNRICRELLIADVI